MSEELIDEDILDTDDTVIKVDDGVTNDQTQGALSEIVDSIQSVIATLASPNVSYRPQNVSYKYNTINHLLDVLRGFNQLGNVTRKDVQIDTIQYISNIGKMVDILNKDLARLKLINEPRKRPRDDDNDSPSDIKVPKIDGGDSVKEDIEQKLVDLQKAYDERVKEFIAETKKLNEEHAIQIKELKVQNKSEVDKYAADIKLKENELQKCEDEISEYQAKLKEEELNNQKDLEELERQCKEQLEKQRVGFTQEIVALNLQLTDAEKRNEELLKSNQKNSDNAIRLNQTNDTLQAEIKALKEDAERVNEQLSKLIASNEELTGKLRTAELRINELETIMNVNDALLLEKDKQIEELNESNETKIKKFQEDIKRLDELNDETNEELKEMKQTYAKSISDMEALKEKHNETVNGLQVEKENLQAQITGLEQEKQDLEITIVDYESQVKELENQIKTLKSDKSNEINELRSKNEELQETVNALNEENDELQQDNQDLNVAFDNYNATIEKLEEEVEELKSSIEARDIRIQTLESSNSTDLDEKEKLRSENETLKMNNKAQRQSLQELKNQITKLKQENEQFSTENSELKQLTEPQINIDKIPTFDRTDYFYNSNGLIKNGQIGYNPIFDVSNAIQIFFYTDYGFGDTTFSSWYARKVSEQMILQYIRYQDNSTFSNYSIANGLRFILHNNFMRDPYIFQKHIVSSMKVLGPNPQVPIDVRSDKYVDNKLLLRELMYQYIKRGLKFTSSSSTDRATEVTRNIVNEALSTSTVINETLISSIKNRASIQLGELLSIFNESDTSTLNYGKLVSLFNKIAPNAARLSGRLFQMANTTMLGWNVTPEQENNLNFYFEKHVKDEQKLYGLALDFMDKDSSSLTQDEKKQLDDLRDEIRRLVEDKSTPTGSSKSNNQENNNIQKMIRESLNMKRLNDFANKKMESDILLNEYGIALNKSYTKDKMPVTSTWTNFNIHREFTTNKLHVDARATSFSSGKSDIFRTHWKQWNSFDHLFNKCSATLSEQEFLGIVDNKSAEQYLGVVLNYDREKTNKTLQSTTDIQRESLNFHQFNILIKFLVFHMNISELDDIIQLHTALKAELLTDDFANSKLENKQKYFRNIHATLSFFILGTFIIHLERDDELFVSKNEKWDTGEMANSFRYNDLVDLFLIFTPQYNDIFNSSSSSQIKVNTVGKIQDTLYFLPNQTLQDQFFYMYTDFLINVDPAEVIIKSTGKEIMEIEGEESDDAFIGDDVGSRDINIQQDIELQLHAMEKELAVRQSMDQDGYYAWKKTYPAIINPFKEYVIENTKDRGPMAGLADALAASIERACKSLDMLSNIMKISYDTASSEISNVYPRIYPTRKQNLLNTLFNVHYKSEDDRFVQSNITLLSVAQLAKNIKRNLLSIASIIDIPVNQLNVSVDPEESRNVFNTSRNNTYKEILDAQDATKKEDESGIHSLLRNNPQLLKSDVAQKSLMLYTNINTMAFEFSKLMDTISKEYFNNMFNEFSVRSLLTGSRARVNKLNESSNYQITYLQDLIDAIGIDTRLSDPSDFVSKGVNDERLRSTVVNNEKDFVDSIKKEEDIMDIISPDDIIDGSVQPSITIIIPVIHANIKFIEQ